MKLGDFKDVDVESTEELSSIDFSMDTESMGILFKGFSDNLYSNKIGSIVREIASNCFDANAESGYTGAVKIRITDPIGGRSGEIQFEDNGPGLSPDRVQNVYSKYFASTKRNTNNEIGGFGIGAKSPFAYTDTFQVITWVDGTEYHYLMHRGVSAPQIKLVYQASTDLPNGTRICIPIRSSSDADKFRKEIRDQLRYFDNIDYDNCNIDNNYQIIRFGPMIFRSGDSTSNIALCIGKVRYPLDKYQLGSNFLNATDTNFSLYFDIGELSVTMNREQIDYNDETIAKIEERYTEAREFLLNYFNEKMNSDITLFDYISLKENGSASITFTIDDINHVAHTKGIVDNPYKGIQHPAFLAYPELSINSKTFNTFCDVIHIVNGKRKAFSMTRRGYRSNPQIGRIPSKQRYAVVYNILESMNEAAACPVYRTKGNQKLSEMKLSYIHKEENHEGLIILQLKPEFTSSDSFYEQGLLASLEGITSNTMEGYRKLRKMALSEIVKLTQSYDKLELPEKYVTDWKNSRKKTAVRVLQDEEIIARAPTYGHQRDGAVDFVKKITTLKLMHQYDKEGVILVYGNNNDTAYLIEAFVLISIFQEGPRPLSARNSPFYTDGGNKLKRGQHIVLKIASNNTRSIETHFKNAIYVKDFLDKADKLYARYLLVAKVNRISEYKLSWKVYDNLHSKEHELLDYIQNLKKRVEEDNFTVYNTIRYFSYRNIHDFETYPIYISGKAKIKHHRVNTVEEIVHFYNMAWTICKNSGNDNYLTAKTALALGFMPNVNALKESKIKKQSRWFKQSTDSVPENQLASATEE